MKAMILCAGLGTRLRPVTEKVAKPGVPFLNIPLLGYSLFYLEELKLSHLVVNTHHLSETVKSAVSALTMDRSYDLDFSLEQPRILNSGGGIWQARKWLGFLELADEKPDDEFIVANGDEVLIFRDRDRIKALVEFHRKHGALATLLTTSHDDVGKRLNGIRTDANGMITEIGVREQGLQHFAGVFIFSSRIWSRLKSAEEKCGEVFHIFKDVLTPAVNDGEKVMSFHDPDLVWLETSDVASFIESTRRALYFMRDGDHYGQEIRRILERYPDRFGVMTDRWGGLTYAGPGSVIGDEVRVEDFAVVGAGSNVKNGILESMVVGENVQLSGFGHLKGQIIL